MTNAPELLPCPFCGGEAEIVDALEAGPEAYVVCCRRCYASSKVIYALMDDVKFDLSSAWNTRTNTSQAAIAAAYEVAASICDEERHNMNAMFTNPPQSAAAVGSRNRIRALIDADALAALEAVKREARMEGFRAGFEQATICDFDDWKDAWAISKMNTAQEEAP